MEVQWWLIIVGLLCIVVAWYLWGTSGPTDVREAAKHREARYNPDMPWWLALWRRVGAGSRIKLLSTIREENVAHRSFLTSEAETQRVELEAAHLPDRVKEARELEAAQAGNALAITNEATANLVDQNTYLELRKKERFDKLDLEKRWIEIEQDLKAGFIFANKTDQYFQMYQEYLFSLYDQRKALEKSKDPAKADKLRLLNQRIETRERLLHEQERLLSAPTQKALQRSSTDSDFPGDVREANSGTEVSQ